jgi:hypothetical protein
MDEPARKTIAQDLDDLAAAARRLMALHPDVQAVSVTLVSRTVDPRSVLGRTVSVTGVPETPDLWLLAAHRLIEAAEECNRNAKGFILGMDELARNLAKHIWELHDERKRLEDGPAPAAGARPEEDAQDTRAAEGA